MHSEHRTLNSFPDRGNLTEPTLRTGHNSTVCTQWSNELIPQRRRISASTALCPQITQPASAQQLLAETLAIRLGSESIVTGVVTARLQSACLPARSTSSQSLPPVLAIRRTYMELPVFRKYSHCRDHNSSSRDVFCKYAVICCMK